MAEGVAVRRVVAGDQQELGQLWLAFLKEQSALDDRIAVSDDALTRWGNDFPAWIDRDQRHIVVAATDDGLVGFASATRHAPPPIFEYVRELYVEELYVAPASRRRGVGRALYDGLVAWGTSSGAQRIRLSVLTANGDAHAFWQRLGLSDLSVSMAAQLESPPMPEARAKSRIGFGV